MALFFMSAETKPAEVRKKSTYDFKDWYEKNKQTLAEKKAKRYREDPDYRAAIMARSARIRNKKKVEKLLNAPH